MGYLALFVALGGTTYAATALPAGSVGARQIRNHSVGAVKLDPRSISASVRIWLEITRDGRIFASSTRARTSSNWSQVVGDPKSPGGIVTLPGSDLRLGHCFPMASLEGVAGDETSAVGYASASLGPGRDQVTVHTMQSSGASFPEPVLIVLLCR